MESLIEKKLIVWQKRNRKLERADTEHVQHFTIQHFASFSIIFACLLKGLAFFSADFCHFCTFFLLFSVRNTCLCFGRKKTGFGRTICCCSLPDRKKIGRKGLSLGRKKMFAPVTPVSAFSEYSNSIKKNN